MKKDGVLNMELASAIAGLGKSDYFAIVGATTDLPRDMKVIDLALSVGVPTMIQVFDAINSEAVISRYIISRDLRMKNFAALDHIKKELKDVIGNEFIPADLRDSINVCKFVVRCGDISPCSNIVLKTGPIE